MVDEGQVERDTERRGACVRAQRARDERLHRRAPRRRGPKKYGSREARPVSSTSSREQYARQVAVLLEENDLDEQATGCPHHRRGDRHRRSYSSRASRAAELNELRSELLDHRRLIAVQPAQRRRARRGGHAQRAARHRRRTTRPRHVDVHPHTHRERQGQPRRLRNPRNPGASTANAQVEQVDRSGMSNAAGVSAAARAAGRDGTGTRSAISTAQPARRSARTWVDRPRCFSRSAGSTADRRPSSVTVVDDVTWPNPLESVSKLRTLQPRYPRCGPHPRGDSSTYPRRRSSMSPASRRPGRRVALRVARQRSFRR